jgi:hypothetical protein
MPASFLASATAATFLPRLTAMRDAHRESACVAGVRPRIETMPLKCAPDAYRRMRSGDVEFRMLLTMGEAR